MKSSKQIVKTSNLKTSLALLAAGLALCHIGHADNVAVVPSEYANTPGTAEIGEVINGYNSSAGQTLQYVIPEAYLSGLTSQNLTGMAFRLNVNYAPDLPQINYTDFTVQLSTFTGDFLSTTFAENLADPTTVKAGAFSFDAGAFPTGGNSETPNGFGYFITFDNAYAYSGGNLLVTIQHAQPVGGETSSYWSVDSYFDESGYGTVIGHDANATDGFTVGVSPITEFTSAPLNANGTTIEAAPEPSTMALAALGGAGLLFYRRRK